MVMEFLEQHTLLVVQDLKSTLFLVGKLRRHLFAFSHFKDEETNPRCLE
jgi:hypothetical protein